MNFGELFSVAHRACAMRLPSSGGGAVIKWIAHVGLQNTPIMKKSELSRKMRERLEPAVSHLLCRLRTHLPLQLKTLSPLSMISLLEGPNGHTKQCLIQDRMHTGFLAFVDSASSKIIPGQGASLVAQWLRICLPMQGTRVQALVWEDPTCSGATRPVSHNYWACASGACAPQREAAITRGRDNERPAHRGESWPPLAATRESPCTETKTQHSQK